MTVPDTPQDTFRIPNLPLGAIVKPDGTPTQDEQLFRQSLITLLQTLFGNNGVVVPSATAAQITSIQNNLEKVPVSGGNLEYKTCQYGTIIYNSSANSIQIAVDNGSGAPVFKTVTLT